MISRHKRLICGALVAVASVTISSTAAAQVSRDTMMHAMKLDSAQVLAKISAWPQASRSAAQQIMTKYGAPAEVSESMLLWGKVGPWKRVVVYREEIQHDFPSSHTDVLETTIDLKVPLADYDDVALFDGSVTINRTKGEVSARCDTEEANFAALNFVQEIATDKIEPAEARMKMAGQIAMLKEGKPAPYTEKLLFTPASGSTADPDKPPPQ
jgi:hypothetical protein